MRWIFALVIATGCGDDYALDIVVDNPASLTVSRTEVAVYEGALTCEPIEMGDLTRQDLEPALVVSETISTGRTAPLSGISRRDPKVIVARAYAPDQTLVASGCIEVGEVAGHETVTITTELAAIASVAFLDRATDPSAIRLVVADPLGQPLDDREVSWRVFAPVGADPVRTSGVTIEPDDAWRVTTPSCTANGAATVHPVPPGVVGGYAIQPRVSWASDNVPLLTAINVDPAPAQFGSVPGVKHPCAIGRTTGGARLVCLTAATDVSAFPVNATGMLGTPTITALGFAPIGLYAAPSGTDVGVFAMGGGGELARVFPSFATLPCVTCGALAIDDVVALPACGGTAKALVHTIGTGMSEVRWVDATGGTMTAFPFELVPGAAIHLNATGCATTLDPSAGTQATVAVAALDYSIATLPTRTRLFFDCTATSCRDTFAPLPGAGVGFTADPQPSVLVASVDATGVVMLRTLLVRGPSGETSLLELGRQPSAAIPHRIVSAHLDEDTGADLLWDETVGRLPTLQVAYAREVRGVPLSAIGVLYKTAGQVSMLDVLAGDLTGDGNEDVVLVSSVLVGDKLALAVLASQVPVTGVSAPADPPCP